MESPLILQIRTGALIQLGIIVLLIISPLELSGQIQITEFMASNGATLTDGDGDSPDWIELHNPTETSVDLSGWFLTDRLDRLTKWEFPDVSIGAGAYLLIYASEKNEDGPGNEIHTNFKLASEGEFLALVRPDGFTIEAQYAPRYPLQKRDVSYGINVGGNEVFYLDPSPGAPNEQGNAGFVAAVDSNPTRGFFEEPFSAVLSTATPAAQIRYTLDGSEPTEASGSLYSEPISIESTTIIRAVASRPGDVTSPTVTFTFIFPAHVVNQSSDQPGFPTRWGTSARYGMNPLYPESPETIASALLALPTISVVGDVEDIFGRSGFYANGGNDNNARWERPVSMEMIFPDGREGVQANAGAQGRSSGPGSERKRGIKIEFKSIYGPSKLKFPIFGGAREGADTVAAEFDDLVLRSGKAENYTGVNYNPVLNIYFRDPMARDTQVAISGYGTRNEFVHLYLNGLYWGLYNLTEGHERDAYATYMGGAETDWFQVKAKDRSDSDGNDGLWDRSNTVGSDRYREFLRFSDENDLSLPQNYERIRRDLDVVNFVDYIIIYNFMAIGDWPDNNWTFVMRNGPQPTPGRFLIWDAEKVWFENDDNQSFKHAWYTPWLEEPGRGGTRYQPMIKRLWQSLLANEQFRRLFADRAYKHTHNDGVLTLENTLARIEDMQERLNLAIRADQMRWSNDDQRRQHGGRLFVYDDWLSQVERVKFNIQDNVNIFINEFREAGLYPILDSPVLSQHGGEVPLGTSVTLDNPNFFGVIYYTTDGSDPIDSSNSRRAGPSAIFYSEPIALSATENVVIKARVQNGVNWSPLCEAWFNQPEASFEDFVENFLQLDFFIRKTHEFSATWLGDFDARDFPWIFHRSLGYIFAFGESVEWFYNLDLGWLWVDPEVFSFSYSDRRNSWLWFDLESGKNGEPSWYFDLAIGEWVSF